MYPKKYMYMRKVIFTLISMIVMGSTAMAQWSADSVLMGTGSANDVFYSLQNGTVKTENNKNWHLAFALGGALDSAAVWANHNAGTNFVKVYNVHKDISQWATVTLADTATASLCYNNDQGWDQGALNMFGSGPMQYGWGHYAGSPSHDNVGDSIFIVKANGVFFKFFINSLVGVGADAGNWNIQIDTFSGSTIYDTIRYSNYLNRRFAYYNLATGADTNREPAKTDWDMVFNRYSTSDVASGPNPFNSVVGALSNRGVKVSKANVVHVDSALAHYGDYVWPWPATSNVISTIGYNWKTFTPPTTWSVPDSVSYFVNDVAGNLYQLQFTGYGGSGQGKIYLRKRLVAATAVNDVSSLISRYEFYPNPTQNEINIALDSKDNTKARLSLTSMSGQVVFSSTLTINTGLNAYTVSTANYPAGHYILSVKGSHTNISEKIVVTK